MRSLRLHSAALSFALLTIAAQCGAVVPGGVAAGHMYTSGSAVQMTADIIVSVDPGVVSYFWAQQFFLNTTVDHGGYFGIQGNGSTTGVGAVGKMFIFSIFNATSAVADAGATAQDFGGEGVGYSIHRTIAWQAGVVYRFEMTKVDTYGWHVVVHTPTGDVGMGTIYVAEDTTIQPNFANFTEYYTDLPSCNALPPTRASFANVTYGGAPVQFNDASPYGTCAAMAATEITNPSINVHTIGTVDPIFYDGFEVSTL